MEMKITKEMSTAVTGAMLELILNKGSKRSMVYQEDVERYLLSHGCNTFVPVGMTISTLIGARYLRYFVLDNGRRMYGFTDLAWEKMDSAGILKKKRTFTPQTDMLELDENNMRMNRLAGLKRRRDEALAMEDHDMVAQLDEEIAPLLRLLQEGTSVAG